MVTMRRGIFRRRVISVAATASGGETTAPSTNATDQVMPGTTACATSATPDMLAMTRPTASKPIARRLAAKSRHEVK